jgi:hypothetical protein
MAQDDLAVANGSGAAVRADLNANLQALGTLMSGNSAPSTTHQFMWWADTANDLLKQRNAANSAWITKGTLSAEYGALPASSIVYAPGSPALIDASNVQDALDALAENPAEQVLVQVKNETESSADNTAATSATPSAYGVTITGVTAGNRIRVRAQLAVGHTVGDDVVFQIRRGSTDITPNGATRLGAIRPPGTADTYGLSLEQWDVGHSGGSITYNLYWWTASGTAYLGRSGASGSTTAPPVIWTVEEYAP